MITANVKSEIELSVIMPCLNEAETIVTCINKAQKFLSASGITGEVLIGDNGSTDGSQKLAEGAGAIVINIDQKGYGAALMGAILKARGRYIIMADSDDSYDFENLGPFMEKLRAGYELVMGNRFKGEIKKDAMPFLHRYLGNPVLSLIGRLFFNIPVGDFHCGLRGFNRESILKIGLMTTGMEFASEMVVKSALFDLKLAEVPTTLSPDGRTRPPHLRTWHDGWRHLRFLLLYSPRWLFLYPGFALAFITSIIFVLLLLGPVRIGGAILDTRALSYMATGFILSVQIITFYLMSKIYAVNMGLIPVNRKFNDKFNFFNLEKGLLLGVIIALVGGAIMMKLFLQWGAKDFGVWDNNSATFRWLTTSILLLVVGIQIIFSSFLLSTLGIIRKEIFKS